MTFNFSKKFSSLLTGGTFLIFALATLLIPFGVSAQDSPAQSLQVEGLAINPFLIEVNASAGDVVTKSIELTNTTRQPLSFVASINDFVPNGTSGQPLFLETNRDADPKFSLSKWIAITKQPEFTIPPLGKTKVEFTITIPGDVEPGTHYGGVLFGRGVGDVDDSGSAVQHKAGAIILVKLGKSQEEVDLDKFSSSKTLYTSGPIEFQTLVSNLGNVHSKPKGEVTIKNIVGGQITQIPINRDANIVLPESKRLFTSVWNPKFAFGRYTAEAVLYYGNPKLELRTQIVIWVIPVKQLGMGVLFALILGIILYIVIRMYNRYIIKRSRNEI